MPTEARVTAEEALHALREMQAEAARAGLNQLTMEEINAEIAAYRQERAAPEARSQS